MNQDRFDRLARALGHRVSRRVAIRAGGVGLAAGGFATAGLASAAAQEATPQASPAPGDKTFFMFVQSFASGRLAPKAGEDARYELTLAQGLGQTLFFSDRPERIVGTVPTQRFLDGLGFTPANPPNAALVADLGGGDEEILVVELFNPRYAEAARTATYDAAILADVDRVDMRFAEAPRGAEHLAAGREYGASHLFIDDCPDVSCCLRMYQGAREPTCVGPQTAYNGGQCWHGSCFCCESCFGHSEQDFANGCNNTYPDQCQGECFVNTGL